MDGSARYREVGAAPHAAVVAAAIVDDDDEGELAGGVLLVATPVATATDRAEVVAPASLPGGYELHCDIRGRPVVVQVPPGGVKQGELFVADVIRHGGSGIGISIGADPSGHRIPTGMWRDGICDCFANGVCHPMLWLACCCRALAIGQVMTRMSLTATGAPIPHDANSSGRGRAARASAFTVVAGVLAAFLVVDYGLALAWFPYRAQMSPTYDEYGPTTHPDFSDIPAWAWAVRGANHAVELAFGIYLLVLLVRTRAHVRHRYGIPEHHCCPGAGCEDCCCSFWLPCCTTLQIARHTAEYDTYPAACCTETGLSPHAPQIV